MTHTAMLEAWQKLTPAQRDYDRFVGRRIPEGASWRAETKSGQMLKDELLATDSCSCHISAPCSFCLQSEEQAMSGLKPSNYTSHPMSSVSKEWEAEQIARNIMTILWRTGDEWRPLTWEEYCAERQKDGNFSEMERPYFDRVISYCKSAEDADRFCSSWRK